MGKVFIVLFTVILLSACNNRNPKEQNMRDDFYVSDRGLDNLRLPLIKPYEILKLNGSKEWIMNLETNTLQFSISNVKEVNVISNVIIIHSVDLTYLRGANVPEAWFVIKPSEQIEKGFSNKEEFISYLAELGIKKFEFTNIEKTFLDFSKSGKLKWQN